MKSFKSIRKSIILASNSKITKMNLSVTDKIKKEILARRLMQLRLKYNHLNLFKMLWNVRKLIYKFKMSRWTTNFIE